MDIVELETCLQRLMWSVVWLSHKLRVDDVNQMVWGFSHGNFALDESSMVSNLVQNTATPKSSRGKNK